jgi:polar amino acid transport system permease protein
LSILLQHERTRRQRGQNEVEPMTYQFRFGDVFASWNELAWGAFHTLVLSALAMTIGMVISVAGALGKTSGPIWLRWLIDGYIEVIRNTPFLIQLFVIFFGLPSAGIRLSADTAAVVALVINVSAYCIEIVRAGIVNVPKGQIEAGRALGLRSLQIFQYIVLKPAVQAIYPSLVSQFVLLMLSSSICSAIAANELTAAADNIQSQSFCSFEVYLVVAVIYFLLSLTFWAVFGAIGRAFLYNATAR